MEHELSGQAAVTTEVSIIIPSYQSTWTLRKCLEAVISQRTSRYYEVIVVHSGPEPISDDLYAVFDTVVFHTFEDRWLPGKARNWAARIVQSPWVLFLDSDCIVDEDWLETLLAVASQQGADGVGGSVRNSTPCNLYSWTMHLLEFGEWLPGGKQRPCWNFPSCNALYRRSLLLEAGGFPEDVFPCEDTVLNYLLSSKGYKLVFCPHSSVKHIHRKNLSGILKHNYSHGLAYGRACQTYALPGQFLTHLGPVSIAVVVPVRSIRIASRLLPQHLLVFAIFVVCMPLALICLVAWSLGFIEARKHSALRTVAL